jgi:hypothetical protein
MSESSDCVDLSGDEPAAKKQKVMTGFFRKFDPSDPAHVAAKEQRERNEAAREQQRRAEAEQRRAEKVLQQEKERKNKANESKKKQRAAQKEKVAAAQALVQQAGNVDLRQAPDLKELSTRSKKPAQAVYLYIKCNDSLGTVSVTLQDKPRKGRPPGSRNRSTLDGKPKAALPNSKAVHEVSYVQCYQCVGQELLEL